MINTAKNLLIMLNTLLQMHLKLLKKKGNSKNRRKISNLIGKKIADTFTKVSKTATYEEENVGVDRKIPRERCISQKKDRKFLIM